MLKACKNSYLVHFTFYTVFILKSTYHICPHKNLYMNTHSIIINYSQKVETTHRSINKWMDEQNGVYTYSGILFSYRKNEVLIHATTWVNLGHIMQRKRSQLQKTTYCKITLMLNVCNRQIYRDRKYIRGCLRLRKLGNQEWLLKGMGLLFEVMKMFQNCEGGCILCEYTKNHWIVHFQWVSYMVYILYLYKAF